MPEPIPVPPSAPRVSADMKAAKASASAGVDTPNQSLLHFGTVASAQTSTVTAMRPFGPEAAAAWTRESRNAAA